MARRFSRSRKQAKPEEPFAVVISRASDGDPDALAAIYRAYAPMVLGYLRANGALEPEDLTGEVFVGVVRGLAGFRGGEPEFRSWLMNIAHRRLLDERRRSARQPPVQQVESLEETLLAADDSARRALHRLHAAGVMEEIERLTPDQRDVLLLHVIADLPLTEVARVTGRTLTATKALWRRARMSIARRLRRRGVPDSVERDEVATARAAFRARSRRTG